jgi:hypothetical protein
MQLTGSMTLGVSVVLVANMGLYLSIFLIGILVVKLIKEITMQKIIPNLAVVSVALLLGAQK